MNAGPMSDPPRRFRLVILLAMLLIAPSVTLHAQTESIPVSRLYADDADVTHFADEEIPWGSGNRTELSPADQIGFLRMTVGTRTDWHPAPRKQYVMVLEGTVEVEAGDGERRIFEPGSVLLVTDTEGRGHRTNVLSDEDVFLVWVPVP